MANEQNLKHFNSDSFTHEEAVKNGRKGAEASAKSRREHKLMQDAARNTLDMLSHEGEADEAEYLSDLYKRTKKGEYIINKDTGKPVPKNLTVEQAAMIAIAKKAMDGDIKALEFLRDTAGEKPVERVEVNADLAKASEEIDALIAEMDDDQSDDN